MNITKIPEHRTIMAVRFARADSNAAMRLTTSTVDVIKSDASAGRAETLRRAMLAHMDDTSDPRNAYPAYWGRLWSSQKERRDNCAL